MSSSRYFGAGNTQKCRQPTSKATVAGKHISNRNDDGLRHLQNWQQLHCLLRIIIQQLAVSAAINLCCCWGITCGIASRKKMIPKPNEPITQGFILGEFKW
jgi:hypothetical protein